MGKTLTIDFQQRYASFNGIGRNIRPDYGADDLKSDISMCIGKVVCIEVYTQLGPGDTKKYFEYRGRLEPGFMIREVFGEDVDIIGEIIKIKPIKVKIEMPD